MSWFSILKKLTGKAKSEGSTLDASKIKVNIEDGPCKKRLKELIIRGATYSQTARVTSLYEYLSEETACHILELIKKYDRNIKNKVEDKRRGEDKTEEYTKDHEIHIFHSFFSNLRRGKRHELYSILVFTKLEPPNSAVVDFDLVIELDLNYGGYEKWSYDL